MADIDKSSPTKFLDLRDHEDKILKGLCVGDKLRMMTRDIDGLIRFASAFYFIRVGFVKLNFIAGSRCPAHEAYWGPVAKNLWEEMGSGKGSTHNELYRCFLRSAGVKTEDNLLAPGFATEFDRRWASWAQKQPILDVIVSLAIYESLDGPDYSMLLSSLEDHWNGKVDLTFFRVHAEAQHLEMFRSLVDHVAPHLLVSAAKRAGEFVIGTQSYMWTGLLAHLTGNA